MSVKTTIDAINELPTNGRLIIDAGGRDEVKTSLTTAKIKALCEYVDRLETALRKIAKGDGAFSRDPLTHAENCVERAVGLAKEALKERD